MKIFLSIKYHPDYQNDERISRLLEILSAHQMEAVCMIRELTKQGVKDIDPQELMRLSLREVRDSKLVIVDLTEKGVGIGIEAGYAHSRGIPIVTLSQSTELASESLVGISDYVYYYRNWNDINRFLNEIEGQYLPH